MKGDWNSGFKAIDSTLYRVCSMLTVAASSAEELSDELELTPGCQKAADIRNMREVGDGLIETAMGDIERLSQFRETPEPHSTVASIPSKEAIAHDTLVGVVEELEAEIAVLRTIWIALGDPMLNDEYGPEYARRALEIATDQLTQTKKYAQSTSEQIGYAA